MAQLSGSTLCGCVTLQWRLVFKLESEFMANEASVLAAKITNTAKTKVILVR